MLFRSATNTGEPPAQCSSRNKISVWKKKSPPILHRSILLFVEDPMQKMVCGVRLMLIEREEGNQTLALILGECNGETNACINAVCSGRFIEVG